MCRFSEAVEPGTVWTWNAIGKSSGAWNLASNANESEKGFLLNHVISEELPADADGKRFSNSDPITGQAAWYDVRVRVYRDEDQKLETTLPQFDTMALQPNAPKRKKWLAYVAGKSKNT